MSYYLTETKPATVRLCEKDFSEILQKIQREISSNRWLGYGWRDRALKAKTLPELMGVFGIRLLTDGQGMFRPYIKSVCSSRFFSSLILLLASYLTDGLIVVVDEDGQTYAAVFSNGGVCFG